MQAKNIKSYIKPYKWQFLAFCLAVVISSASVLSIGKGLSYFIDRGIASSNQDILLESLLLLFVIIFIMAIAIFARFYLVTFYGEKIIADIRRDIFSNLINLSAEFFEKIKLVNYFQESLVTLMCCKIS